MRACLPALWLLCACSGGTGGLDAGGGAGGGGGTGGGGPGGGAGGGSPADGGTDGGVDGGGTWSTIAPFPLGPRQETAVAALDGKVYVAGGFVMNGGIVARVEVFDPADGGWSTSAALPKAMHHANLAAVNGKLYVVGGLEGLGFTAIGDVYEYTPGAAAWVAKTAMPAAQRRGGSGVAVSGGKIYLVGGFRGGAAVNDFTSYDPAADLHATLPSLPTARDHLVAGAAGTRVFAIGGRGGAITAIDGRVDAFDTTTNTWSPKAPMPTPRAGTAIGAFADFFVVAGGEGAGTPSGVFDQVEAYFPASDTWRTRTPMKTPRHGTGGAVVGDTFYMPGGATVQAFGATPTCEVWRP